MENETFELPDDSIPNNAMVMCPLPERAGLISVKPTCQKCEHHRAIGALGIVGEVTWDQQHRIVCTYRRLLPIAMKVDE